MSSLPLPVAPVQAPGAAEPETENHVATMLILPGTLTPSTLEALGCICRALLPLGHQSCCELQQRHLLRGSAARNTGFLRLCHTVLSTHVMLLAEAQVPFPPRRHLGRRMATTWPVLKRRAMIAQRAAAVTLRLDRHASLRSSLAA
jgi:hypothetical protein